MEFYGDSILSTSHNPMYSSRKGSPYIDSDSPRSGTITTNQIGAIVKKCKLILDDHNIIPLP